MNSEKDYYKKVGAYYDIDSTNFESRYDSNTCLQRIRNSFRKESEDYAHGNILEIGYGPGLDITFFASKPNITSVYGLDISDGMYNEAKKNAQSMGLKNTYLDVGSFEDIERIFPGIQFDLIYVYFGALNTVHNLNDAPEIFKKVLKPDGKLVLTFVNKWYLLGIIKPLVKLKFKTAFRRLGKTWDGYSPAKKLNSKCYSYSQILKIFKPFTLIKKRGYSIFYPAWYENKKYKNDSANLDKKWELDKKLQRTPFWNLGEYSLYIFK